MAIYEAHIIEEKPFYSLANTLKYIAFTLTGAWYLINLFGPLGIDTYYPGFIDAIYIKDMRDTHFFFRALSLLLMSLFIAMLLYVPAAIVYAIRAIILSLRMNKWCKANYAIDCAVATTWGLLSLDSKNKKLILPKNYKDGSIGVRIYDIADITGYNYSEITSSVIKHGSDSSWKETKSRGFDLTIKVNDIDDPVHEYRTSKHSHNDLKKITSKIEVLCKS